jgi:hypothetical protein
MNFVKQNSEARVGITMSAQLMERSEHKLFARIDPADS